MDERAAPLSRERLNVLLLPVARQYSVPFVRRRTDGKWVKGTVGRATSVRQAAAAGQTCTMYPFMTARERVPSGVEEYPGE